MKVKTIPVIIGTLSCVLVGGAAFAAVSTFAGPHDDGTAVTSVGMRVTPTGQQTALGDLPLNSAISPGGKRLAVTNNGQGTQSLQLVGLADHEVDQTLSCKSPESLYMGLAWARTAPPRRRRARH